MKYSIWKVTVISLHSLFIFVCNYTHRYLVSNPSANPVAFTLKYIHYPTTSSHPHHHHLKPGHHQASPVLQWLLLFLSSFQSGCPAKSILHIEDKVILLKGKWGQASTLIKVLQRHTMSPKMKLNFWYGLQDPILPKLWPPWPFHLLSPLGHQHTPTPLAFLFALRHAKQGFPSGLLLLGFLLSHITSCTAIQGSGQKPSLIIPPSKYQPNVLLASFVSLSSSWLIWLFT